MSANAAPSSRGGPSAITRLVVAVCLLAAVVAACVLVYQKTTGGSRFSDADCQRLTALKNEALAALENEQLPEAIKALKELGRTFPNDPIVVRNLAIAHVLSIDKKYPADVKPTAAAVLASLDALSNLEPDSPVPHILAAHAADKRGDIATKVAEFQIAGKLAPADASNWFEAYNAAAESGDETLKDLSPGDLATALLADPANSYLLLKQALVLVELLHEPDGKEVPQDAPERLLKALKTLQPEIQPLDAVVRTIARKPLNDLCDEIYAAIESRKWRDAWRGVRTLNNSIYAQEWVKSDMLRLQLHPLAYMVHDFATPLCRPEAAGGTAADHLPIRIVPLPADRQLPGLRGVRSVDLSDFDLDGLADVLALTENRLHVFTRAAADKPWKELLAVDVESPMSGLLVADLDRDSVKSTQPVAANGAAPAKRAAPATNEECQPGDVEVVVFGPAGVAIFRNELDPATSVRSLVAVEQQDSELAALRNVVAGALVDIDHDGDLDLVFSSESGITIWSNQARLQFANATSRSTLPPAEIAATTLVAVDWDRDVDVDILVSGPTKTPAGWLENLRHGAFRWRPFEDRFAELNGSSSLNVFEVDGNVSWDVIGAGPSGIHLVQTQTAIPGKVTVKSTAEVSRDAVARSLVEDFDNDSHSDLVAWSDSTLKLFQASSDGRFTLADGAIESPPANISACAAADLDGDGDLDLVIADPDKVTIYDNDSGNRNHWLAVRSRGETTDKRGDVNHLGIGSLLEVKSGPRYQAQVVKGQVTHFGLGKTQSADVLRAVWTNGVPQPVTHPELDSYICRIHDPKGSCPYVYAWTGSRYEFLTDACWGAPLGLQFAPGVFAPSRSWEYLLVPGERLVPKDGRYSIQMTEELWEATYVDHMSLIAVDHPADVEVFSNEKVGPAEISEFKIHTVRRRRPPVAARDPRGRDVLDKILVEDGVFMKGFEDGPQHGLTDEHYLELDLGDLGQPKQITLFLTGWMFPTSTSLNLAVAEDPSAPRPRPPALWTPDASGNWRESRPFMGFPGGKTKTIAVDISDVFTAGDHRLRIVTNQEFYWDAAFFTVDEPAAPLRLTPIPVASADLHYRGFSNIVPNSGFGPAHYDYSDVRTEPKWPPMKGCFTRFGDVTELLGDVDDRMVVIGAGDEMTVEFAVPPDGPPEGWKRDFILHNDGWDKDADLNVLHSQTVEPLPFHAMSGYPYPASESYPDTEPHREYLRTYQTRTQPAMPFWRFVHDHPGR